VVRADLTGRAAELLRPEWLAARRWSGARDRVALEAELLDAVALPLPDGSPVAEAWLLVAEVRFADGGARRYLLPVVGDGAGPLREPADGDGAWRAIVLALADVTRPPWLERAVFVLCGAGLVVYATLAFLGAYVP